MNYAEIKRFDVANSPYIGSTLFVSGCKFNCKGCFNKEAQDFNYGKCFDKEIENLFISYLKHPQVKHANLLGGEIMQQDYDVIIKLVKRIKAETNCDIWLWSGYTWEELIKDEQKINILKNIDILIDGRFEIAKKDLKLKYRGSSNQRVIDVQESLKENKLILSKYN